ncbi:peroxidase TAP [Amylocystis lapponica]|nr:peroxidase TAP [Amylocystis lapponica]
MSKTTTPPPLDLNNIQGDILAGLPKRTQTYVFFQIDDNVTAFRTQLSQLVPLITTTAQVVRDQQKIAQNKKAAAEKGVEPGLIKLSGVNIAFSHTGLVKLGITADIGDSAFKEGQLADAANLGDQGTTTNGVFSPNWIPAFKNLVHGVILVSGDSHPTVEETLCTVEAILGVGRIDATIHEVLRIVGDVRPGAQKGHEHFGYLDGISQPAVKDFDTKPNPGQETVRQGIILLGRDGDSVTRPSWAKDGSFLALRYFFQLVPELNAFKRQNSLKLPGLTQEEGSELLGARMFGRWTSGAPVDVTPLKDDPALGADPSRNNDFRYALPRRLTYGGSSGGGVPFGPEVTPAEEAAGKTQLGRGLIFVAYQSNIVNGFQFAGRTTQGFPIQKPVTPGYDPIVGQASDPTSRTMSGANPDAQSTELPLPMQWVVPKGGEYFFSPSISALQHTLGLATRAHVASRGAW